MPQKKKKTKKLLDKAKSIGNINITHPFAFGKLPYHIQHSRQMDYRWVEYDYASHMAQQWGIRSARQWKAFVQFFNPAGMPTNPDQAYPLHWDSWPTFLNNDNLYAGYDPASVRVSELLPYNDALAWTQSKQFPTVEKFFEAWDDGQVPKGIPRQPQVRYKEFYPKGGWKYFLGKKIEAVMDAKKNIEPVCALLRTVGMSDNILTLVISNQGAMVLAKQIDANPEITAVKAYYWHHDFAEYIFEMFNTMGTKQSENSWLFPDLNNLYYELGSVLEEYRPR